MLAGDAEGEEEKALVYYGCCRQLQEGFADDFQKPSENHLREISSCNHWLSVSLGVLLRITNLGGRESGDPGGSPLLSQHFCVSRKCPSILSFSNLPRAVPASHMEGLNSFHLSMPRVISGFLTKP